jgi:two-component system, NarL family, sensor kinase
MRNRMKRLWSGIGLSYGQKLFLLATLPLVLAVAAISVFVVSQSRQAAQSEIAFLETELIAAKKAELRNYLSIARTAFINIYGRALPDDDQAKLEVSRILAAMLYGRDGYFFVFDYDGNNLVSPRRTELIGRNWIDFTDDNGERLVARMIEIARNGGGYLTYDWPKPSTGKDARMVSYVVGMQDWRWAVGTGIFIDDVLATVANERADVETRVRQTFLYIGAITLAALLLVFTSGMFINIRERRLADAKLKKLTQRVFDAQEEERGRVARELHDGISQILVGVRYALDNARRRLARGDEAGAALPLDKGIEALGSAISEVRRISRDLRPGVLDDLGLGPALKTLTDEFGERTGIRTEFNTVVFRNRLDQEAKIALYRIAQEALTNIERHSGATSISIDLRGHKSGATMRISDNGRGLPAEQNRQGLGLRNMQERIEQLDGTLLITSSRGHQTGTVIEVRVPLSHMLSPGDEARAKQEIKT